MRIAAVFAVIGLFLLPFVLPEGYLYVVGLSLLFAIAVASWDLMVGYTGKVNLGHTVFIGVGGYTAALLQKFLHFPFYLTIPLGGLTASLLGFFIGLVTLRLRGHYFALVTAILPLVFMQTVFIWRDIFGGEEGFSIGIENALSPSVVGRYYIATVLTLASLFVLDYIANSKLGLKFRAIRDDEDLAESLGIDTTKYKIVAFVISSFFAGITGGAIVHYRITVSPDLYDVPLMLLIILSAVIGGLGTIYGPFICGILIYLSKNWWLKEIIEITGVPINDEVVLYTILIVVGIFFPKGIFEPLTTKLKSIFGK